MVATFMESCCAGTFFPERPGRYWMLFQVRQLPLPRTVQMPSHPSTYCARFSLSLDMSRPPTRWSAALIVTAHLPAHNGRLAEQARDGTAGRNRHGPAKLVGNWRFRSQTERLKNVAVV